MSSYVPAFFCFLLEDSPKSVCKLNETSDVANYDHHGHIQGKTQRLRFVFATDCDIITKKTGTPSLSLTYDEQQKKKRRMNMDKVLLQEVFLQKVHRVEVFDDEPTVFDYDFCV